MLRFKEMDDKKKRMFIIVSVLVVFIGISFAYVVAQISGGAIGNANITADTTDNLQFNIDKDITLNPTQFNVVEGGGGHSDTATGTASLLANSTNKSATFDYYVYFQINTNEYIYTTEDQKPEIVLTITDPTDQPVTSVDGLKYVTAQNADGTTVSGFDITTQSGLFNIASNYEITSSSSTQATEQDWIFTVTFINLTTNQAANGGSTLDAEIILSKDERYTLAGFIQNQYTTDGENGLYYHDGVGSYTNADQEAGDNSYRYAGANPNNYVCFCSTESPCPEENLYRIIGIFDDDKDTNYQIKLIKADYVTNVMLGTDGRDYYGTYDQPTSYYQGSMDEGTITAYRWNYDTSVSTYGSNNWTTSEFNRVNLNTNYWNYLGATWQNLIAETTWHLGGMTSYNNTAKAFYDGERNNAGYGSNPTTYTDEIGLMYPSDYGYAANPDAWATDLYDYDNSTITANNWMYMGLSEWTIIPYSSSSRYVFNAFYYGILHYHAASLGYAARPVFYLKSNVALQGGSGTSSDPFILAV